MPPFSQGSEKRGRNNLIITKLAQLLGLAKKLRPKVVLKNIRMSNPDGLICLIKNSNKITERPYLKLTHMKMETDHSFLSITGLLI